jgi:hypothetical protein
MVISAAVSAPTTVAAAVVPTTVITSAAAVAATTTTVIASAAVTTTTSATVSPVPIASASIIICKGRGCGQEGVRREERYEESSREQGAADCPENDMQ